MYRVDESRGRQVVPDTLGDSFAGVPVSDCLASYENLPYQKHKCYAHHLRAIARAAEAVRDGPEERRIFLMRLRGLLKAAVLLKQLAPELPRGQVLRMREHLEQSADALLGSPRGDAEEERVAQRLRKRRHWLFTFLDHPGVKGANNRAERALRPAVMARKLSCGNKTPRGKWAWEILTSLAVTCQQQARDFVEALRPYLLLTPSAAR